MRSDFVAAPRRFPKQFALGGVIEVFGNYKKRGARSGAFKKIERAAQSRIEERIVLRRVPPAVSAVDVLGAIEVQVDCRRNPIRFPFQFRRRVGLGQWLHCGPPAEARCRMSSSFSAAGAPTPRPLRSNSRNASV